MQMNCRGFSFLLVILLIALIAVTVIAAVLWYHATQTTISMHTPSPANPAEANKVLTWGMPVPAGWRMYYGYPGFPGFERWGNGDTWTGRSFTMIYPDNWTPTTTLDGSIEFNIPLAFALDGGGLHLGKLSPGGTDYQTELNQLTVSGICERHLMIDGEAGIASGGIGGIGEGTNGFQIGISFISPSVYRAGIDLEFSAYLPPSYTTSSCVTDMPPAVENRLRALWTAMSSFTVHDVSSTSQGIWGTVGSTTILASQECVQVFDATTNQKVAEGICDNQGQFVVPLMPGQYLVTEKASGRESTTTIYPSVWGGITL
jgi:hypothetical protein